MKNLKILALILASLMLSSSFVGCDSKLNLPAGETTAQSGTAGAGNTEKPEQSAAETTGAEADTPVDDKKDFVFPTGLTARKIKATEKKYITVYKGGLVYDEDDLKGIIAFDGSTDTGAKYTYLSSDEKYFVSSTSTKAMNETDVSTLNVRGLIDHMGNVIIPEKYASVDVLNDRYAQVIEVTERTFSKDDAILYISKSSFISFAPDEDDPLFKGNWYIYDITTGEIVEGVTGTNGRTVTTYGSYIKYYNADGDEVIVNGKNQPIANEATLLENGSYTIEGISTGGLFDTDGNKLFSYDPEGFVPTRYSDGYYVAEKYDADYNSTYVLMDSTGKVVSAEFKNRPEVYGNLIISDEDVYDFKGNKILSGDYYNVYSTPFADYSIISGDDKALIKNDGTVIYIADGDDDSIYADTSSWNISKESGDDTLYYSLKNNAFTLKGRSYSDEPFMVEVEKANGIKELVDIFSEDTVISGYTSYDSALTEDGKYYIYGFKDKALDVYEVTVK